MKTKGNYLPWGIVLAGVLFSLYLLWQVPDGVYFSGDGGLKALLAQQLSAGIFRFDLVQPSESWVRDLWAQGLYPYKEPFVYHVDSRYFITFPFPFSLVTAPFHSLFGYRGLYVIPLVATWAIWGTFYWMCSRLKLSYFNTSLALIALTLASNLTLYSAMYWEHTLAVALCFAGIAILLVSAETSDLPIRDVILSGCLVGLSAWVRSEFLAMIGTLTFLAILIAILRHDYFQDARQNLDLKLSCFSGKKVVIFTSSMFFTLGLFFACNQLIYGYFLGIHALQITNDFSLMRRLREALESFQEISVSFFSYFPVALFSLLYLLLYLFTRIIAKIKPKVLIYGLIPLLLLGGSYFVLAGDVTSLRILKTFIKQWGILLLMLSAWLYFLRKVGIKLYPKTVLICSICLFFTIGVALLVDSGADEMAVGGKQWGPRYLLILIPLLSFLVVQQLDYMREASNVIAGRLGLLLVGALLAVGLHKNLYQGTVYFTESHQGVKSAIQALQTSSDSVFVVSHQYAAQMLEPSLKREHFFFQAEKVEDLVKLGAALAEQDRSSFLYVCYPHHECELPKEKPGIIEFSNRNKKFEIQFSSLGKVGKYPFYEAKLVPL